MEVIFNKTIKFDFDVKDFVNKNETLITDCIEDSSVKNILLLETAIMGKLLAEGHDVYYNQSYYIKPLIEEILRYYKCDNWRDIKQPNSLDLR